MTDQWWFWAALFVGCFLLSFTARCVIWKIWGR